MNKIKINADLVVKIVLIIVIIILLLHNCMLIRKDNKDKVPTGNVDIIEINCDKEDVCVVNEENDKLDEININSDDNNLNNNTVYNKNYKFKNTKKDSSVSINEEDTLEDNNKNNINNYENDDSNPGDDDYEEPEEEELIVYDPDIKWHGDTPAKIFTNSMYGLDDVIAPESHNTYQFVVKNGTVYNLKYNINFIEDNLYGINMQYKLKKNDTYIVDHYVSASELDVSDVLLSSKKNDTYYLEWRWVSSDNDTEIGANPNSKYELKINIEAESTND